MSGWCSSKYTHITEYQGIEMLLSREMGVCTTALFLMLLTISLQTGCATVALSECKNRCEGREHYLVASGVIVSPPGFWRNWMQVDHCACKIPTHDSECRTSNYCTETGRCSVQDGRCVASSVEDCKRSAYCKMMKMCSLKDGQCQR